MKPKDHTLCHRLLIQQKHEKSDSLVNEVLPAEQDKSRNPPISTVSPSAAPEAKRTTQRTTKQTEFSTNFAGKKKKERQN